MPLGDYVCEIGPTNKDFDLLVMESRYRVSGGDVGATYGGIDTFPASNSLTFTTGPFAEMHATYWRDSDEPGPARVLIAIKAHVKGHGLTDVICTHQGTNSDRTVDEVET